VKVARVRQHAAFPSRCLEGLRWLLRPASREPANLRLFPRSHPPIAGRGTAS
jgi:hypothetical protein